MRIPVLWVVAGIALLLVGLAAYPVSQYLYARHHFVSGEAALNQRDFARADAHLTKCLAVWPNEPGLHILAARSARQQGDVPRAESHLRTYRKNRGPSAPRELELRLLRLQGGDLSEAKMLLAFCDDNPDEPEIHLVLEALVIGTLKFFEPAFNEGLHPEGPGRVLIADATKALDQWEKLRQGEADRTQAMVWRGRLALTGFDYPRASELLGEALKRDDDHFEARLYLALAIGQRAPVEAVDHLRTLHERDPSNRRVHYALATGQRGLGRHDEAKALLDSLLKIEPDMVGALTERGRLALESKPPRPLEAERDLRRAVQLAPDNIDAHLAMAAYFQTTGEPQEAKKHQDTARRLDAERKRKMK